MMLKQPLRLFAFVTILLLAPNSVIANPQSVGDRVVAIFDFKHTGQLNNHLLNGEKVSSLLSAFLTANQNIRLVDRKHIDKLTDELLLSASGMVTESEKVKIGHLTGAEILVTGEILNVDNQLMLTAKIIGTETSRVVGVYVLSRYDEKLFELIKRFADEISSTIARSAADLVVAPQPIRDGIAETNAKLPSGPRPSITVHVVESHIRRRVAPDPAAEIELIHYLIGTGFPVIDAKSSIAASADLSLVGEGFTEFATRRGDLIGVSARVEIRVIDNVTKQIIAVERHSGIEFNVSEVVAGKTALQRTTAKIAERLLPKLMMTR